MNISLATADSPGLEPLAVLTRLKIVPLITLHSADAALPLAEALTAAGLPVAEVGLRTPAAHPALRLLAADPRLLVGAGTVCTTKQADFAADAGARFIVTPGFSASVTARCMELGLTVIPGIATATELQAALEAGLHHVKFFPAEPLGGVRMLRALAGPYPDVRFLPAGGVTAANLASYLAQPSVMAVSGSWLVPEQAIRSGDFGAVTRLAVQACAIAGSVARLSPPTDSSDRSRLDTSLGSNPGPTMQEDP
jgi:2-dehydro-3-deoxyphosphogluconate aldolase/(4S)-4-hydroxy-2-oxoglutarate aldolase